MYDTPLPPPHVQAGGGSEIYVDLLPPDVPMSSSPGLLNGMRARFSRDRTRDAAASAHPFADRGDAFFEELFCELEVKCKQCKTALSSTLDVRGLCVGCGWKDASRRLPGESGFSVWFFGAFLLTVIGFVLLARQSNAPYARQHATRMGVTQQSAAPHAASAHARTTRSHPGAASAQSFALLTLPAGTQPQASAPIASAASPPAPAAPHPDAQADGSAVTVDPLVITASPTGAWGAVPTHAERKSVYLITRIAHAVPGEVQRMIVIAWSITGARNLARMQHGSERDRVWTQWQTSDVVLLGDATPEQRAGVIMREDVRGPP